MKSFLKAITICIIVFGCKTGSEIKTLIGNKIVFPEDIYSIDIDRGQLIKDSISDDIIKIVIWFDSIGCNQCRLKSIYNYGFVEDYCNDTLKNECYLVEIFSPSKGQLKDIVLFVWENNLDIPIVLDIKNEFQQLNPMLPKNDKYHSFLLNKENEIVLVGPPNYNHKMWSLYKSLINSYGINNENVAIHDNN